MGVPKASRGIGVFVFAEEATICLGQTAFFPSAMVRLV